MGAMQVPSTPGSREGLALRGEAALERNRRSAPRGSGVRDDPPLVVLAALFLAPIRPSTRAPGTTLILGATILAGGAGPATALADAARLRATIVFLAAVIAVPSLRRTLQHGVPQGGETKVRSDA